MRFTWDERKNAANVRKHGISFADAWKVFAGPMIVDPDDRTEYGEDRWIGIGRLDNRIVVVVYTEPYENTTRLISVRRALKHEQFAYETALANRLGKG